MKIKITKAPAIETALADVNGNAEAFTITRASELVDIANRANRRLETSGIPLKLRAGTLVSCIPSGPEARSYGHLCISTQITMVCGSDGRSWYLVGAERAGVYPRQSGKFAITISSEAADIVTRKALAPFNVRG